MARAMATRERFVLAMPASRQEAIRMLCKCSGTLFGDQTFWPGERAQLHSMHVKLNALTSGHALAVPKARMPTGREW